MSIVKQHGMYAPTCDICGTALREVSTRDEAVAEMKEAGWLGGQNKFGDWEDFCPDCQEET